MVYDLVGVGLHDKSVHDDIFPTAAAAEARATMPRVTSATTKNELPLPNCDDSFVILVVNERYAPPSKPYLSHPTRTVGNRFWSSAIRLETHSPTALRMASSVALPRTPHNRRPGRGPATSGPTGVPHVAQTVTLSSTI